MSGVYTLAPVGRMASFFRQRHGADTLGFKRKQGISRAACL
jgi:hypothetical protein